ncbi:MAG: hypothetical protein RL213_1458 [Bacteroidota bacterium]|jgi:hypothetical protein
MSGLSAETKIIAALYLRIQDAKTDEPVVQ